MDGNLRKIIFFILLIGVACCAYQFMIKPANKNLADKKAQVQKKLEKLQEFERASAAAEDLEKQLEKLQKAIEYFESKLPPKSEIHKVLEQVTIIAQKQGLEPKTIRTLQKKQNSGYIEQPLEMQLVGDFNSFYSFLLQLEDLPRIMKIRELKLRKQKDNKNLDDDGQISADFVVSIFFQNKTT